MEFLQLVRADGSMLEYECQTFRVDPSGVLMLGGARLVGVVARNGLRQSVARTRFPAAMIIWPEPGTTLSQEDREGS